MNESRPSFRSPPSSLLLPLSCCLAALACGADDATSVEPADAAEPAATPSGPEPAETRPLYFLTTTVSVGDVDQGYLVPLDTLAVGTTFDLSRAVEVSDSTIAGTLDDPYIYVGSSADPTITRWELQSDGSLQQGPTLSLAGYGLTRASVGNELFLSPERAYITDDANQQLVIWNPRAMAVVGTIPLGNEAEGALQPYLALTVQPDRLLVAVSWQESFDADWSRFGTHVRLINIDPQTNEIVSTMDDTRCNYAFWGMPTSDGTAYYSPLSYYTPIRAMLGGDRGVDSCGLRVVPAGASFDGSYEVDLSQLVGGRPAGNLFFVADDVALLRVWHSELVTPIAEDKSNWQDAINEAGFLWWRWRVGDREAVQLPDQSPGASEVTGVYSVDGRRFMPRVAADYSRTTLDELDASGAFIPTLSGPGNIWGIVRKR
jgi:hypothetical protein